MATSDQLCPECGYDRSGLEGKPCPECGCPLAPVLAGVRIRKRAVLVTMVVLSLLVIGSGVVLNGVEITVGAAQPPSARGRLPQSRFDATFAADPDGPARITGMWIAPEGVYLDLAGEDASMVADQLCMYAPALITVIDSKGVSRELQTQKLRKTIGFGGIGDVPRCYSWRRNFDYVDIRRSNGDYFDAVSVPFYLPTALVPGQYTVKLDDTLCIEGIDPGSTFKVEAKPVPKRK